MYRLDHGRRGRVNDDVLDRIVPDQVAQHLVIRLVVHTVVAATLVIQLLDHNGFLLRGAVIVQASGKRVDGAVVHGHIVAVPWIERRDLWNDMRRAVEHGVDKALGLYPQTKDITPVENAGVHSLISGLDFRRKTQVVVHREMKIQDVPLSRFLDPFHIEPVTGVFGVAVEPELRTGHAATSHSLLHERARHEGHFVEQHARKRDALHQCVA